MAELGDTSAVDGYLLAQSILADSRKSAGVSQVAVADGATVLGRALVELGARADVQVIAGAQDADEESMLKGLGATGVIRCDNVDFVDEVMRRTDGLGVDLVVDQVAGPHFERNFDMLADFGDIVITGWTAGDPPHLFETMWAKLDRCPSIQLWTLDRYRSRPEGLDELKKAVAAYLSSRPSAYSETDA